MKFGSDICQSDLVRKFSLFQKSLTLFFTDRSKLLELGHLESEFGTGKVFSEARSLSMVVKQEQIRFYKDVWIIPQVENVYLDIQKSKPIININFFLSFFRSIL